MTGVDLRMVVRIRYTNYRGETAMRRVVPRVIHFTSNEWHPEPQWIMEALDLDRGEERSFAIKDIHEWRPDGDEGAAPSEARAAFPTPGHALPVGVSLARLRSAAKTCMTWVCSRLTRKPASDPNPNTPPGPAFTPTGTHT